MSMKYFSLILCSLSLLALCACSGPIGKTPYEPITSTPSIDSEIGNSVNSDANATTTSHSNDTDTNSDQSTHNTKKTTSGKDSSKPTEGNDNAVNWDDIVSEGGFTSKSSTASSTSATSATSAKSTTSTTATTRPAQQEEAKGIRLPAEGYSPDGKIQIGTVSLTGNTVSMEIKNITTKYQTNQDDYFEYTCYDENDKVLKTDKIYFGRILKKQSRVCTFTIPDNTASVALTDLKVEYWTDFV